MQSTTPSVVIAAPPGDDGRLIRASLEGDRDAFRQLFERHSRVVRAYACARVGDADADDVLVETFEVAWRRRDGFDHSAGSARPWLLGIATNLVLAHGQSGRRWRLGLGQAASDSRRSSADQTIIDHDIDPELADAIASLSNAERTMLVLVALGELSVVEAARVLGITPIAARVRLHRARRRVQAQLRTEDGDRP